jgi:hypothetical protein
MITLMSGNIVLCKLGRCGIVFNAIVLIKVVTLGDFVVLLN